MTALSAAAGIKIRAEPGGRQAEILYIPAGGSRLPASEETVRSRERAIAG